MQRSDRLEQTTAVADRADAEVFRSSAVRLGSTVPSISLSRNTGPYCQSPSPRSHPAISMRGSVILPKRASSPSTKAGGVPPRPRGGVAGVPLTPELKNSMHTITGTPYRECFIYWRLFQMGTIKG
jgi:hypothetical protein